MAGHSIGEASRASGVKVTTIRFYEERGLLAKPARSDGNRRQYDDADLARLRFIRHARDLGFPLETVVTLLQLTADPARPCQEVDGIALAQLAEIDRRIAQLSALRGELSRMVGECSGGTVGECRVVESLADHGHCHSEHRVN